MAISGRVWLISNVGNNEWEGHCAVEKQFGVNLVGIDLLEYLREKKKKGKI